MANISDIIEEFILKSLSDDEQLSISRNELASFFSCAPSQINYVLSTRFSLERGFVIESRRGGGGSITLIRLSPHTEDTIADIINSSISDGISYARAVDILNRLIFEECITAREGEIITSAISDKALISPFIPKENLRAGIMRSVLTKIMQLKSRKEED